MNCKDCKWYVKVNAVSEVCEHPQYRRASCTPMIACEYHEKRMDKGCDDCKWIEAHATNAMCFRGCWNYRSIDGGKHVCDSWAEKPPRKLCHDCEFINAGCVACDGWESGEPVVIVLNECEHEEEPTIHVEISGFSISQNNCDECVNFERKVNRKDCTHYRERYGEERCASYGRMSYLCADDCGCYEDK